MHPILILFAHPALHKSRVNRVLIDEIKNISNVTFHDLYEVYPEFDIDIKYEQKLLLKHEIIVFHYPFFWYSTPAILKEWQDLVLEHGWAYGKEGTRLQGKKFLSAITTGGSEIAYQKKGYNRFTIRQLLAPTEQTAYLCGMEYLPPFVCHGTHQMKLEDMKKNAEDYQKVILALRDGKINLEKIQGLQRINLNLENIIKTEVVNE
jgi:glutathione-regulated potassium-efflux system ancillary protein KefG